MPRAVDGPLDGGRDLGEERAVQIVPGTGIDRAGGTGRRRRGARFGRARGRRWRLATSVGATVAVSGALAVGSTVGSVLAGAAATVDVADGSSRVWSAPMQPVATTATSIGRSSHGWDRRRAGRDRRRARWATRHVGSLARSAIPARCSGTTSRTAVAGSGRATVAGNVARASATA